MRCIAKFLYKKWIKIIKRDIKEALYKEDERTLKINTRKRSSSISRKRSSARVMRKNNQQQSNQQQSLKFKAICSAILKKGNNSRLNMSNK